MLSLLLSIINVSCYHELTYFLICWLFQFLGGLCVNHCQEVWNCFSSGCGWSRRRDSFTSNNCQVRPFPSYVSPDHWLSYWNFDGTTVTGKIADLYITLPYLRIPNTCRFDKNLIWISSAILGLHATLTRGWHSASLLSYSITCMYSGNTTYAVLVSVINSSWLLAPVQSQSWRTRYQGLSFAWSSIPFDQSGMVRPG